MRALLAAVLALAPQQQAEGPAERLGVARGLCAVVGDPDAALDLARKTELLVYLQLPDADAVEKARRAADAAGLHGTRLCVEKGEPRRIHLADNLADALVDPGGAVPEAEALRVVRPHGRAILGTKVLVKPWPEGMGEWSHPHHGPDNNPFSQDRAARPPFLTQFVQGPRNAPVPQITVSSAGRVFKLYGHLGLKAGTEGLVNTLVALNGFNGTVLWERKLKAGFMSHRCTLIASPSTVYLADDASCRLLDAATGKEAGEIAAPEGADGPVWKWMGKEGSTLYALLGPKEEEAPEVRSKGGFGYGFGWPEVGKGFHSRDFPWQQGRTLAAFDTATRKVLWTHAEKEPIDGRAVCVGGGRLHAFRFGSFLASFDAGSGRELWRRTPENAPELFKTLGEYKAGPNSGAAAGGGFPTSPYVVSNDKAICLTGLPVDAIAVVSTEEGRLLWSGRYSGRPILDGEVMYLVAYGMRPGQGSRKVELLTGKRLGEFDGSLACARATAGAGAGILYRAREGTLRYEPESGKLHYYAFMRPTCTDGVTLANGSLYWWPWVCRCVPLLGTVCLASASGHKAAGAASLEGGAGEVAEGTESPRDWPTFKAADPPAIPKGSAPLWQTLIRGVPTAPTAAGGMIFLGGADGIVRALDGADGKVRWTAYTGGPIRFPPTLWKSRALVGSGDGWVYSFEAASGRLLWRFRAAPAERKILVFGALTSTWPAATNVVVDEGVAYVAAGMFYHDGTHVYALDAASGRLKWENSSSGQLNPDVNAGVSVGGQLLLQGGKLYLAGGTYLSPGIYDAATGACLNVSPGKYSAGKGNTAGPWGWKLAPEGEGVKVSGALFYGFEGPILNPGTVVGHAIDRDGRTIVVSKDGRIACYAAGR